jgi:hypothetical protein
VIDDGAGAVARIGPRVVDVALVAGLGARLLGILAADKDAAVGVVADPELGVDLEVLVFVLRDQERVGRAPAGGLFNHLVGGHLQVSGTVMPRALAVLRLTTSSIALVDTEG